MKRTYETSHPWLSFTFVAECSPRLWMQLGEVLSKCEHIAGTPLTPKVQEEFNRIYLARGAHATTRIEGNTLSEQQVRARLDHKLQLPESQEYLGQEVDNVLESYALIIGDLQEGRDLTLTPERIREINRLILKDMDTDDHVDPGQYRTTSVGVGPYLGAPAEDCEYLVDRLCVWLRDIEKDAAQADDETRGATNIIAAILAHLYLAWIHPFGDGNGRTARMVEFQLLAKARVPVVTGHLLSDHYNKTRTRYLQVLDQASNVRPYSAIPFVTYAVQGLVDGAREQIGRVRDQHLAVTWINYVNEVLGRQRPGDTTDRRRQLVLALDPNEWTPKHEIRRVAADIAESYAAKTDRTIARDISALERLGLLDVNRDGVRPALRQLSAFMPLRAGMDLPRVNN